MSELKVGGEVDAFCTKCKLVLAHTVLAVWAGQIKRVRCNTCMGEHGYRRGAPGASAAKPAHPRATAAPKSKAAAEPTVPRSYVELLAGRGASSARRYNLKEKFAVGELVQHPSFGLGVVGAARGLEKIDVAFPGGVKTLLHNKGAGPAELAKPLPSKQPDVELADDAHQPDPAAETSDEQEDTPPVG